MAVYFTLTGTLRAHELEYREGWHEMSRTKGAMGRNDVCMNLA